MNGFVISNGTAIRLADIIAVHTDGQGRNIVFLTNGLWIELRKTCTERYWLSSGTAGEGAFDEDKRIYL